MVIESCRSVLLNFTTVYGVGWLTFPPPHPVITTTPLLPVLLTLASGDVLYCCRV